MRKHYPWLLLGAVSLVVMALAGCLVSAPTPAPRESRFGVMGTYASVIAGGHEAGRAEEYAKATETIMRVIEADLSLYRTNSLLSQLNARAGTGSVEADEYLRANIALARRFGDLSHGTFDVTVGPLVRLWGFSGGKVPTAIVSEDRIEAAKALVGYKHLQLDGQRAFLDRPGMVVDLGGIAKGYAVDVCCDLLRSRGARDFTVNLSGNMRCYGRPAPERPWRIGVRDPFDADGLLGSLDLENGMSVSTSGNYERFVMIDGHRYIHIIDPRTGRPVEGMAGVTVICPSAADADGLSTTLFVLGVEEGTKALRSVPGAEALFVPDRQPLEIDVTRGMTNAFHVRPDLAGCVRVLDGKQ